MKNVLISIFILLLFGGCAMKPKYFVNVDSIGDIHHKTKYFLMSGLKNVSTTDLEFQEYAKYINKALQNRGFTKTDFKNADIAIFLRYGISAPQKHTKSYSIPIYGQTGVSSSTTYGTLNSYGNTGSYQGNTYSNSTTYYTPTYGIKGYQNGTREYIQFTRYYELSAVDLEKYKRTNKNVQLWKTTVTSTGSSGDLRRVFPILVAASEKYIGLNTGKKIKIKLYENDKNVLELKGIKTNEK
jgi:hypothetical protein